MKSIQYFLVTTLAVAIGHVSSWSIPVAGPSSALFVLAILYGVLRKLRRKDRAAASSPVPVEVVWTIIAFCALFVGGLAGMMAFNPDGYMQPKPSGAPWWLIIPGTLVGAVGGGIIAGLLSLLNRLATPQRR